MEGISVLRAAFSEISILRNVPLLLPAGGTHESIGGHRADKKLLILQYCSVCFDAYTDEVR
jgi:hypothetical protein